MNTTPDKWLELGEKDVRDTRFDFSALHPKDGIEHEIEPDRMQERYEAVHKAIGQLTDVLNEAAPDVIVVFSNPHGGVTTDVMQPTFGIHLNDVPPHTEGPGGWRPNGVNLDAEGPRTVRDTVAVAARPQREFKANPTDGDLARHLMEGLIDEGFDVAANFQSNPGAGLDGAYNLLYQKFDREGHYPYVPVLVSRYRPNQATPKRTYQFGQAVRRVIEQWDSPKRVAVMGSGGLSHQVIDEELDQAVIDALQEGNPEALFAIDRDRLNFSPGTPEILNWVACAGVMAPKTMTLIDYIPCYRSLAGTGHGNTFGFWK